MYLTRIRKSKNICDDDIIIIIIEKNIEIEARDDFLA